MRTLAIVQARMGSTRLPGKVMLPLAGKPAIFHVLSRLKKSKVDDIVVAVPWDDRALELSMYVSAMGIQVLATRAADDDLLTRFWQTYEKFQTFCEPITHVVRVTADCPAIDPAVVDDLLSLAERKAADYASVATWTPSHNFGAVRFPDGLDCEVFTVAALRLAWANTFTRGDREHIGPWMVRRTFDRLGGRVNLREYVSNQGLHCVHLFPDTDYPGRLTLDTPEDYGRLEAVFEALPPGFGFRDALKVLA